MTATKVYRFVTKLAHVECVSAEAVQAIRAKEGAPRATVSTSEAFEGPGKYSFEVFMKNKKRKTAVGFLSECRTTEYMRDSDIGEAFVSFGGAGWIHPKEMAADHKYAEGDRVKAEVDFDEKVVRFYVNSELAGEEEWTSVRAFPAVSIDGGHLDLEVTF